MQESVQAAYSYIRSRRAHLGLTADQIKNAEIHLHVPEGATPKDGPSAGIAICTAVLSALSGIPALASVAMTGEITLRGNVLPIGGLREKLLAALRGGIDTVIIPKGNVKDLDEVPQNVKRGLKIMAVSMVDEVFALALETRPVPLISSDTEGLIMHEGTEFVVPLPNAHLGDVLGGDVV
jgi:ATP-dependent Lon protease